MSNYDITKCISHSIATGISKGIEDSGFDRTRTGQIIRIYDFTCDVKVDGKDYFNVLTYGKVDNLRVGQTVKIIYPCNQTSQMYIEIPTEIPNVPNITYPIGSIYISSNNTNPSTKFGGTWSLTYKKRIDATISGATVFTRNTTNITSITSAVASIASNVARISLGIVAGVVLNDTAADLGTINLATLGVSSLPTGGGFWAGVSDGGNSIVMLSTATNGSVDSIDIVGATTLVVGSTIRFEAIFPLEWTKLSDAVCDEWHWKRTA